MKKIIKILILWVVFSLNNSYADEFPKEAWLKAITQGTPKFVCIDRVFGKHLLNKILQETGNSIESCLKIATHSTPSCLALYAQEFPVIVNSNNPINEKIIGCVYKQIIKSMVSETNQVVTDGNFSVKVVKVNMSNTLSDNEYLDKSPDGIFLFIQLIVRNNDSVAHYLPRFSLLDTKGDEYETSNLAWRIDKGFSELDKINPNIEKYGKLIFDVPPNEYYFLKISDTNLSSFIEIGGQHNAIIYDSQ